MQPGCGECQPHCCDNAWAGYCQEKARQQAFWYRVGSGEFRWFDRVSVGREPACVTCEPTCVTYEPAEQSLPPEPAELEEAPLPPLPEPAAEKTSSK